MADEPTTLQLVLPPDPRLLRILRLVASGVASLGEFDLGSVEEVRVAVDELGSTLINGGNGSDIEVTFELIGSTLRVDGRTALAGSTDLEVDPLTDRILDVVATTHTWASTDGVAHGHIEKEALPAAAV